MSPRVRGDYRTSFDMVRYTKLGIIALAIVLYFFSPDTSEAYEPWWVQNHLETELWSGPDGNAQSFGRLEQWNYLKVVSPQHDQPRLHVWNPKTKNYAYVDAEAVGPSGPPPKEESVVQTPAPVQTAESVQAEKERIAEFEPWWAETQVATDLWSGIDDKAISFGRIPRGTEIQVVSERKGNRYYVNILAKKNYAYVDADAVVRKTADGTADQSEAKTPVASAPRTAPTLNNGYDGWWVSNFLKAELWSRPDANAISLESIPQFRRFLVVEPQNGDRLKVWYPEKDILGYLDASVAGPSCPSVWVEPISINDESEITSYGRTVGEKTYARALPVYDDETALRKLASNSSVTVTRSVVTADGKEWYELEEGGYVLASEVRLPRVPNRYYSGRWIDVDLDEPTMVTAYEGNRMVKTALAIKGVNNYPTPVGNFQILRRVVNETMDSETIGIPRDNPGGYLLKNVLYTQYFTNDGASFHYNYWRGTFGYPGSHGCLGLNLEDSKWFWEWSDVGTPVVVRSNSGGQMIQTSTNISEAGDG